MLSAVARLLLADKRDSNPRSSEMAALIEKQQRRPRRIVATAVVG
jgi:hypothetical protein